MKSAALQGNFQRVRARCERIFAKGRHFPSELVRSKQERLVGHGRHRYSSAKCWLCYFTTPECGWYRGNYVFPSQFSFENWDFIFVTNTTKKGEPPLVCSPSFRFQRKFTPSWRFIRIRSFAICGWRPTLRALDPRKLFEKSLTKTSIINMFKNKLIYSKGISK